MARGLGNGPSDNVSKRQAEWNATGTNATIGKLRKDGTIVGRGGTTDTEEGNYTDGYFGAQEYLRHGGTSDSWAGHEDDLKKRQEMFKEKGLDYYQDPDTGMYKLRKLGETPEETPEEENKGSQVNPEGDQEKEKAPQKVNNGKFNIDPRIYSIAHNAYANAVNDKMTVRQIDAMRRGLTLYDPKNNTKYLEGDFDALMQGEQAAGQIMHMASQPMTSDGALQTAAYLDSATKAQDYIRQGRATNNQALKKSKDEIWKLRYDDDAYNHDVAMKNRQSIGDLIENIANVENARDAKNYTNNDVLFQELMMPVKQEANKRKALEEKFAMSDIHNAVANDPNSYGAELEDDELEAWNLVQSGDKSYSQLESAQQQAFMKAQRKISQAE